MEEITRGLAIAGGGAKGAYSFGCLKALRSFRFDAVAGTSAGALNAAIAASGDFDLGERLWLGVTPEKTLRPWRWMRILGKWPGRLLFLAILLPNLLVNRLRGRSLGRGADRVANLVLCILLFAVLGGATSLADTSASYFVAAATAVSFLLILRFSQRSVTSRAFLILIVPVILMLGLLLADSALRGAAERLLFSQVEDGSGAEAALMVLYAASLFLVVAVAMPLVLILGGSLAGIFSRLTAFDAAGLRETIQGFLAVTKFRMPVYATVAKEAEIFDPDDPFWIHEYGLGSWHVAATEGTLISEDARKGPWLPSLRSVWLPRYARLRHEDADEAAVILTASAALPFGVTKPVFLGGTEYVDGGVADNYPLFPLVEHGCDEIFLLCLDSEERESSTGLQIWNRERFAVLKRRLTLAERGAPDPVADRCPPILFNDPPSIVPLPAIARWPHIIVFRPRRRLGGLFGGLLNFSARYTREMIELGESDMRRALFAARENGTLTRHANGEPSLIDLPKK